MIYRINCQWLLLLLSLALTARTHADLVQWQNDFPHAAGVNETSEGVLNTGKVQQPAWFVRWQRLVADAKQSFRQSVIQKSFGGLQAHDWNEISVQLPLSHVDWPEENHSKAADERDINLMLMNLMKAMLLLDLVVVIGVAVMMRLR